MRRPRLYKPIRRAFTLVELLVSMALTLFIMTILVEAFGTGMDTFQGLRSLGDLQDQLRSGMHLLKQDLSLDHFEGGRRTSDLNFWNEPRREGFFAVRQGSAPAATGLYVEEGTDLDGVNKSYLARNHVLHFAVRQRGNRRDQFFFDSTAEATVAAGRTNVVGVNRESTYGTDKASLLTSPWGECAYFLDTSTATTVPDTSLGNPSYGPIYLQKLYRVERVVVPFADTFNYNTAGSVAYDPKQFFYTARKSNGGKVQFFTPNDLARGATYRSFDPTVTTAASYLDAALVCTNVVSFQVRILKDGGTAFEDVPLVNGARLFDSAADPGYRLNAVQITIRIYDPSSGLTRQATLNHEL